MIFLKKKVADGLAVEKSENKTPLQKTMNKYNVTNYNII